MISRRNIRVKVMQTIYAAESMQVEEQSSDYRKILESKFDQTAFLFGYFVYFLTEVARYAETDAKLKAGKHLPTAEDLNVSIKISGNHILWKILENKRYIAASKQYKFDHLTDTDLIRKIYQELSVTEAYKEYIELDSREKKWEKKIIEHLCNSVLLPNESFINHIEELFINWDDDAENIQTMLMNLFNKPEQTNFTQIISKEKSDYAFSLLDSVLEKKDHLLSIIKPKLKNWEADRIAHLDLIMIEMGVCEFLYFETIPTRVTINEYIDLAKAYSTPQSGQFVNGILDNILKEISQSGQINKITYKNSTL